MALQKNDFIEIDFTGKTEDGNVFDSNIKDDLKKINPEAEAKPFVFCLGQDMFLKGVDEYLIGKEIGKHEIKLAPEDAFGKREPKLVQMIPLKVFHQHKINPVAGASFNFDNKIAKILTVSGGRVMTDFNHPLAGKKVIYSVNVKRKLDDLNEKIKSFSEFLFRKEFPFKIKDKKIIFEVDKGFRQFAELFKDKFKEIFGLEMEVEEVGEEKESEDKEEKKVENKEDKKESEEK